MDTLPDALRDRLQRLNADLTTNLLKPADAVWLACDLLVAGVDSPALIELAGESPTELRPIDAAPLVRRAFAELGIEPVDPTQALWVIVRDVARQMVAGQVLPEDGARTLWGLWSSLDDADEVIRILEPLEAWDDTPPAFRDDDAIRAEMRRIAGLVLRVADGR